MEIEKTLHEVSTGVFAYTQLPGSGGWSNAGLIIDDDQSRLIDTLFDRRITGEMLATMRRAAPAAQRIGTVVNTHGNGDHCYGNGEVPGAEIIGSQGCVDDLAAAPPSRNATLMRAANAVQALGGVGRAAGRICSALGLQTVAWLDSERVCVSVHTLHRDFAGNLHPPEILELLAGMARLVAERDRDLKSSV